LLILTPIVPIAITFVIAVIVVEIVLSAKWNRAYFTIGLPIFVRRVERPHGLADVSFDDVQKRSANAAGTPLAFHRLDTNLIAFREKTYGGMLHYAPLMRGVIHHTEGEQSVVLRGLVNWWFVALTITLLITLGRGVRHIAMIYIFVLAILYLIQGVRFYRVASALRSR